MRLKERKRKKAVSGVRTQDQYSDKIKTVLPSLPWRLLNLLELV